MVNSLISLAASGEAGPVKFRLGTASELNGAGALFDYGAQEIARTGSPSVVLDPSWLVGPNANLTAIGVNRTNSPCTAMAAPV